jgi:hypothetical protein
VGQGRRPRACCTRSAHSGGEGSPSGPHYEGSAFDGWTGARRAGRKSRARGVGNHTALPPEARSRQPKIAALERRKAQRPRFARGRAMSLARGRGSWLFDICIFPRSCPRKRASRANCAEPAKSGPPLARGRTERVQTIRVMMLGCLILRCLKFESECELLTHTCTHSLVTAGLDPAVPFRMAHCLYKRDARVKPAHDEGEKAASGSSSLSPCVSTTGNTDSGRGIIPVVRGNDRARDQRCVTAWRWPARRVSHVVNGVVSDSAGRCRNGALHCRRRRARERS